jgi:hypothetical protein
MAEINRGERLQIMLTEEEVKALDDWRCATNAEPRRLFVSSATGFGERRRCPADAASVRTSA